MGERKETLHRVPHARNSHTNNHTSVSGQSNPWLDLSGPFPSPISWYKAGHNSSKEEWLNNGRKQLKCEWFMEMGGDLAERRDGL